MTDLSVGDAIYRLRIDRQMTQEHLAALCQVHKNTIKRIEKGHEPTLSVLSQIAAGLNIDLWRLVRYSNRLAQRVVP